MEKDKIELKTVMESAAVADYLEALARGFRAGRLRVEKDGESLELTPAETAEVEVEARVKKDKARFSVEVTWREAVLPAEDPASLKISAGAPDPASAAKPCCAKEKDAPKPEAKPEKKDEKKDDKADEKKPAAAAPATPAKPAAPAAAPAAAPKN